MLQMLSSYTIVSRAFTHALCLQMITRVVQAARVENIENIDAGDGDDIVDLTSQITHSLGKTSLSMAGGVTTSGVLMQTRP